MDYDEIIKMLIAKGVNLKEIDTEGNTPLMVASIIGNIEIMNLLIKKKADLNAKSKDGQTALLYAIQREQIESAKLLIEKGADLNIMNNKSQNALLLAYDNNNIEIFKLLLENGADLNIMNNKNQNVLFLAYDSDNIEIFKLLLENGANANFKLKSGDNFLTTLKYNDETVEILKLLVVNGADPNIKSDVSPLTRAIRTPNIHNVDQKYCLAKLMIEHGANVNAVDDEGATPILQAIAGFVKDKKYFKIVELLLKNGADYNYVVNFDGTKYPVYELAKKIDDKELLNLFKKYGAI